MIVGDLPNVVVDGEVIDDVLILAQGRPLTVLGEFLYITMRLSAVPNAPEGLSSWTKEFIHFMILVLMGTPKGKPLLAATFSNKPR